MKYKGIVQKGGEYGRRLGFPTANIPLLDASIGGIFAARVKTEEREYAAAAYADQQRKLLEMHLLDFDGDLYGKDVEVELLEKIRDGRPFANDDEAKAAIANDVAAVRDHFNRR